MATQPWSEIHFPWTPTSYLLALLPELISGHWGLVWVWEAQQKGGFRAGSTAPAWCSGAFQPPLIAGSRGGFKLGGPLTQGSCSERCPQTLGPGGTSACGLTRQEEQGQLPAWP